MYTHEDIDTLKKKEGTDLRVGGLGDVEGGFLGEDSGRKGRQ